LDAGLSHSLDDSSFSRKRHALLDCRIR
jgi:hypothetical protein